MKAKKITVIIEASSTGFGVYSDKLPAIQLRAINKRKKSKQGFIS